MLERLQKHPIVYATLLVCFFLFWTFPEWLGEVWPLFTDKKIPQWFAEKGWFSMNPTFYSLSTGVIGIILIVLLGVIICQQIIYQRRNKKEKILSSNTDHEPEEHVPTEPPLSFPVIAAQTADLIDTLKNQPGRTPIKIKIVATPAYMEFAKALAKIFRVAEYQLKIDQQGTTEIFPAERAHGEIVIRYRENKNPRNLTMDDVTCIYLSRMLSPWLSPRIEKFPKESTVDYFQIELGGAPSSLPDPPIPFQEEPFRSFLRRLFSWTTH